MDCILFDTPIGVLGLAARAGAITNLYFPNQPAEAAGEETALLRAGREQLLAYFSGTLQSFDLPLRPEGTPFRRQVWQALCDIPYGQTITYGELARRVDNPKAVRAVGQANHHNPISILIPCHRVVGAGGVLTGYGGGLHIKRALLTLEGADYKE